MRYIGVLLSLVAVGALTGCPVGANLGTFEPAQRPGGITVEVTLLKSKTPISGELLAVQDSAFLVLNLERTKIVRIKEAAIRRVKASYGSFIAPVRAFERDRIRAASRYPKGVGAELEKKLLDAYRLNSVTMVDK
jgi:hypothetical protein